MKAERPKDVRRQARIAGIEKSALVRRGRRSSVAYLETRLRIDVLFWDNKKFARPVAALCHGYGSQAC